MVNGVCPKREFVTAPATPTPPLRSRETQADAADVSGRNGEERALCKQLAVKLLTWSVEACDWLVS